MPCLDFSWRGMAARGSAASWMFSSRRKALILLAHHMACFALPNVRAKRATTVGRQARAGENVPRTDSPGLVACLPLALRLSEGLGRSAVQPGRMVDRFSGRMVDTQ